MQRIFRSAMVATIATVMAVTVSGCHNSSKASSAGTTTAAGAAAGATSAAAAPSSAGPALSAESSGGAVVSAVASPIAASSGAVQDPCVLVTAADVSGALGVTVPPSTSEFTGTYQICSYNAPQATAGDATVIIVLSRLIDKAGFDANAKQSTGEIAPLPGVCQDAYVAGSKVYGWKNGTEVDTSIDGMPAGSDPVAAVTKLDTGACAKL